MKIVKLLTYTQSAYKNWKKQIDRVAIPSNAISRTVLTILQEVEKKGDAAVFHYTKKFDKISLKETLLRTKPQTPSPTILNALKRAKKNIEHFSHRGMPKTWQTTNAEGAKVGEIYHPLQRVGIYIPGGTAPLVSTSLMTITLAAAAGCPEIVVATPPPVNSVLHFAIRFAGATEIHQIGGAQAIGALAFGTKKIKKVQKIFGPGNAFVNEAKRQVVGHVAIDQLPGPSEIMIIADESAHPEFIAADLLAQAEHGADSSAILLTPSIKIRDATHQAIQRQLQTLSRKNILAQSLARCACLVQTRNLSEAMEIANLYAPEHLSLQLKSPKTWILHLKNAGAIFLGSYSPVVAGDFVAGPSHTLPTGGAGKSFSGLTIDQFFRRTSLIEYSKNSLEKIALTIETLTQLEKLDAHQLSAQIRFRSPKSKR
ncbi:MAG: histidinol dehydrogenase [Verrucomicrobiae bacterium]|nr:histidinol dehydrogenase [Verrucomicrobiae bacterium]